MLANLIALAPFLANVLAAPMARQNAATTTTTVVNNCNNTGQVALTFDDGPYIYESNVTADLGSAKGTFFLNGDNYVCIYDKYQEIQALYAAGHTLGSHTWSHADLTLLDEAGINSELSKVEDAFVKILGVKPLYFRPPYGNYNDTVLSILAQRGYKKLFMWSDDTEDADGETVSFGEGIYDGVISSYPKPHLVLDHSTIQTTSSQLLPYAIPKLESVGYTLVTVDTCLGSAGEYPYMNVSAPGTPDDSWHC